MVLDFLVKFINEAVLLFFEMAPYIMLGIGIAGLLHVILSKNFVARHIGGNNIGSVFKAALFGVPLPLCSCGVVPTAVYLKNSGASKAAVTSFLISTPQTGIDSITAAWGMLGPVFAVFKALAALIIGMAGGVADYILDRKSGTEKAVPKTVVPAQISLYPGFFGKIKEMFNYAVFELLDDIAVNFTVGLAIAAVISIAIPDNFFASSILSNPIVGMIVMVAIGIPMYICSTSSIPIAVALIAKGVSPGAAYVFLVAGPATNAASLAIISKTLGKKTTIRYLVTLIAGSMIFGFAMDLIYRGLGLSPFGAATQSRAAETQTPFLLTVSIVFLLLLLFLFTRRIMAKIKGGKHSHDHSVSEADENSTRIKIEGMDCNHCSEAVKSALNTVSGIGKIEISLEGRYAEIDGDFSLDEAEDAIRNAGYEVTKS